MNHEFDWSDLAFASKRDIKALDATFIGAAREMSAKRFTQLVKEQLPKGNIVLGLAKEPYVEGFESQPQFRMLQAEALGVTIKKVNASSSKHKIYTLHYFQREAPYVIEKLKFARALFVNGSWKHTFHTTPTYYALMKARTAYQLISPFVDEQEAKAYDTKLAKEIDDLDPYHPALLSTAGMLGVANEAAKHSFDYNFQTGAALGRKQGSKYELLLAAFNKVVPFQTYALHYGASRETHFSPPHDLNHYDTVHAEVKMILRAGEKRINLSGATLFVNLMPCPACARMLAETEIDEIVYGLDHSDGYAVQLLEKAGKKVRRVIG